MAEYYGKPVYRLSVGQIELDCLVEAGPRIVRLCYKDSQNLLAEVPQTTSPTLYGDYHFWGGHRLWHAPESMPRSYIPDDEGVTVIKTPNGVILDGKTEPATHIRKKIEIRIDPSRPAVSLQHTLMNEGLWEIELSPWAITMFRLGGVAILPMWHPINQNDLLPNRHLALWSYSHIQDSRLTLSDDYILIKAQADHPPFKIGTFDQSGWIGYWMDGILFRKRFDVFPHRLHPDHNSNAEIYCNDKLIELESLAPLTKLAPGGSVEHDETWEFYDQLEVDFIPASLRQMIESLG
ncbi:MAG: hypothetical protein ACOY16_13865 [Chloroflexota bacterium]